MPAVSVARPVTVSTLTEAVRSTTRRGGGRAGAGRFLRFTALCLLLSGWWGPPPVVEAQEPSAAQLRLDLDRLRSQISSMEERLAAIGDRRESLIDEFEAVDLQLALSRRQLDVVQVRLLVLFQQSQEQQAEVDRLNEELVAARENLSDRVVAMYRMGPLSYSRFLLAADDAEEILSNYQLVNRLATQDRSLVVSIDRRLREHEAAVEMLADTTEQLTETRAEETLAIRRLTSQQLERQRLIRDIDVEAAAGRRALARQEESAAVMEDLLVEVGDTPVAAPTTEERPTFAAARGSLPWPAPGTVTETFGRKVHPVYGTVTLFKGIEIAAEEGGPVLAVFPGRVSFADWFPGASYGQVVIVGHGNGFVTIYGHLDELRVRTGDWVDAGAEVGTVGETGSLIGPSLYFEIREGSEAINPAQWLQRR